MIVLVLLATLQAAPPAGAQGAPSVALSPTSLTAGAATADDRSAEGHAERSADDGLVEDQQRREQRTQEPCQGRRADDCRRVLEAEEDEGIDGVSWCMMGLAGVGIALAVGLVAIVVGVVAVFGVACLAAVGINLVEEAVCAPLCGAACGLLGIPTLLSTLCESVTSSLCAGVTAPCDAAAGACSSSACSGCDGVSLAIRPGAASWGPPAWAPSSMLF